MRRDASVGVDLYGRDVSASKALKDVGKNADKLANKINDVSARMVKGMAMATTAAAAAAVAIGVDAVKAAVEDQKSTAMLQQAIEANTHATRNQIKAVDDYITKQQMRFGVDDDLLKNGLGRLVRVTHDVTKAQQLLNLAIDVSAGTGKSLDTVTTALAKAYGGNLGALSRLGITMDKSIVKNKDLRGALKVLKDAYGGAGTAAADTFKGRLDRVNQAVQVAKEKMGYLLLPYVEKFAKYVAETLVPALDDWITANGPKLQQAIKDVLPKIQAAIDKVSTLVGWAVDHKDTLIDLGKQLAIIFGAISVGARIYTTITALTKLVGAFQAVRTAAASASVAEALATGGVNIWAGLAAIAGAAALYAGLNYALSSGGKPSDLQPGSTPTPFLNRRTGSNPVAPALRGGGVNIEINVAGNVTSERDLTKTIQTNLTQWMKRQGVNNYLLGQGKQ